MTNIIHPIDKLVKSSVENCKIAFLGTPQFAVPILERLVQSEYQPAAVFCAPDKPVGRQQVLTPPPVKIVAQKYNIPVFQPANSRELVQTVKPLSCDIIITAAYGLILPKEALDMPKFGCLNIHPSLLPKYRGAAPIHAAILNGDAKTGVTIFKMDEGVDTGPILITQKILLSASGVTDTEQKPALRRMSEQGWRRRLKAKCLSPQMTTPELTQKLSEIGADLLLKILPEWITGNIKPQPQDDSPATYTKPIKKEDGRIDWHKSAEEIERQIRAYTPWPGSYGKWLMANGLWQTIKIIEADQVEKSYNKKIGEVFLTDTNDLAVQTGHGALIIRQLQLEGGKPTPAADFIRGHKEIMGQILK